MQTFETFGSYLYARALLLFARNKWVLSLLLVLGVAVLAELTQKMAQLPLERNFSSNFEFRYTVVFPVLLLGLLAQLIYPRFVRWSALTLGLVVLAVQSLPYYEKPPVAAVVLATEVYLFACIWILVCVGRHWAWRTRVALYSLMLVAAFFMPLIIRHFGGHDHASATFRLLVFFAPFLVKPDFFGESPGANLKAAADFVFSPVQKVYSSLPVPPEDLGGANQRSTGEQAVRGLLYFAGGLALGMVSAYFQAAQRVLSADAPGLLRGWLCYVANYFYYAAWLYLAVGAAAWTGWSLAHPTRQALLATNLVDRWKRWNLFFYWFYLTFIWLPIARRTNTWFIATLAVFLIDFVWHNPGRMNSFVSGTIHGQARHVLGTEFLFYLGQAFALYLGYRLRAIWPSESRRSGWIGVGACHVIMAGLYWLIS